MRMLLIALVWSGHVTATELAQPMPPPPAAWPAHIPRAVLAVSSTASQETVLLRESCGWPSGARRAYHSRQGRVTWACWGYTEQGIAFEWSTGEHTTMTWQQFRTANNEVLTYPGLYLTLNPPK
jgi:hypothetical protein